MELISQPCYCRYLDENGCVCQLVAVELISQPCYCRYLDVNGCVCQLAPVELISQPCYCRYLDENEAARARLANFLGLLKLPLLAPEKLQVLKSVERIQGSPECLKIIERAAAIPHTDQDSLDTSPWARPRNAVRK